MFLSSRHQTIHLGARDNPGNASEKDDYTDLITFFLFSEGPFVICTVNRACQLPEMQVHHNFKMFLLTNRMDGVKGFMARFLRRRIIEAEFRLSRQTPPELVRVIQFLPIVLQAVNSFIEKANSLDVTIGPRIFLQCPLGVEESRAWFVRLWNQNIIPYMVKVAREGKRFSLCLV
ncbi:hypothetical protein OESDEN_11617 [Oesophagostomum dentatum]|uniref:CortBP2/NAV1-like AAA+ ATPase lid domain-containing protein n=1 Tax=Oesophagostomum dentatum TaxID=61180 RepID=A0A0B1SYM2_OESDE|nr:hypothetical protein OESDEN_11617 [Oesophagostomum dentatum]